MNIIITDQEKQLQHECTYVSTFQHASEKTLIRTPFPGSLDPDNAELMLHALHNLCAHPEVFEYIKNSIPSAFLPARIKFRQLPVYALLNYLAGPSNIFHLAWQQENIEYNKDRQGLGVGYYRKYFLFPYDSWFSKKFIDAYGTGSWGDLCSRQAIQDWDFMRAENDVGKALHPFNSYFVTSTSYPKLCTDLFHICLSIEQLLDEGLFSWIPGKYKKDLLSLHLHRLQIHRQ
jgi:hypothetical protein